MTVSTLVNILDTFTIVFITQKGYRNGSDPCPVLNPYLEVAVSTSSAQRCTLNVCFWTRAQPSAGLLAGTMDELLAALLGLWQRCPSPFSWTWKLWQWLVHLTPYVATLISCSEDVLLHSCGGWRNSIKTTGTCKEQLLSCFDKRNWAGFHDHRAIPQSDSSLGAVAISTNALVTSGNIFQVSLRTFLAFAREKQHSVTAC